MSNQKKKRAEYKITPTPKQRKYFEERMKQAKEHRTNKKEAALNAGYPPSMANSAMNTIESTRGFRQLIEDKLPDGDILDYLAEDLRKKPQERLPELKLVADIKGWRDKNVTVKTDNTMINLLKEIIDK